jgi:hypothetical protein
LIQPPVDLDALGKLALQGPEHGLGPVGVSLRGERTRARKTSPDTETVVLRWNG